MSKGLNLIVDEKLYKDIDKIRDYFNLLINDKTIDAYSIERNKKTTLEDDDEKTIIRIDKRISLSKIKNLHEEDITGDKKLYLYLLKENEIDMLYFCTFRSSYGGGVDDLHFSLEQISSDIDLKKIGLFSNPFDFPIESELISSDMPQFRTQLGQDQRELKVYGKLEGLIKKTYDFIKSE